MAEAAFDTLLTGHACLFVKILFIVDLRSMSSQGRAAAEGGGGVECTGLTCRSAKALKTAGTGEHRRASTSTERPKARHSGLEGKRKTRLQPLPFPRSVHCRPPPRPSGTHTRAGRVSSLPAGLGFRPPPGPLQALPAPPLGTCCPPACLHSNVIIILPCGSSHFTWLVTNTSVLTSTRRLQGEQKHNELL